MIDIGAGSGEALTSALIDAGLSVCAIDASSTMVTAFRQRFPNLEIACEPVEQSRFFDRAFDAVLAIGLMFLLPVDGQRALIQQIAAALKPDGRVLFSAPHQICNWDDLLTGLPSRSLGAEAYCSIFASSGLQLIAEHVDEGETHYYEAKKNVSVL